MALETPLRLVIVTPEKTLLDEPVAALRFPLYDGSIGILPGRLPLIGRLGSGELKVTPLPTAPVTAEQLYFVDGGFVQVRNNVVTILTNTAIKAEALSAAAAQQELEAANRIVARGEVPQAAKASAQQRARNKLALARKAT